MRISFLLCVLMFVASCGYPRANLTNLSSKRVIGKTVDFHIKKGTLKGRWNEKNDPVIVKVGDVINIINDDTIVHALHTNGRPCPHGSDIPVGAAGPCVIDSTFDPNQEGHLWDHYAGNGAEFWIHATE